MNLGKTIRNIRQAKGISQGDLEKRTGLLRSHISRLENGHAVPSFTTLQRIASALEVSLDELLHSDVVLAGNNDNSLSQPSASLKQLKGQVSQLSVQQRTDLLILVQHMANSEKKPC